MELTLCNVCARASGDLQFGTCSKECARVYFLVSRLAELLGKP